MPKPAPSFPQPQVEFAEQLRVLRLRAGQPTEQALANAMGCGRTTVSDLLNGRRFPSWELLSAFVEACGGSPRDW
ncbi:helix-turn-helix domain-containing protein, partial [Marinitenerispora sediminis]